MRLQIVSWEMAEKFPGGIMPKIQETLAFGLRIGKFGCWAHPKDVQWMRSQGFDSGVRSQAWEEFEYHVAMTIRATCGRALSCCKVRSCCRMARTIIVERTMLC